MRTPLAAPLRWLSSFAWPLAGVTLLAGFLPTPAATGPVVAASAEGDVVAGIVLWPVDDAALAPAYLAAEALAATAGREGEQPLVAALPGHVAVGFRVPARRTQRLAALLAPLLAPRPPARQALAAARESLEARAREDRRQGLARVRRQALLALLGPAAAAETLEARPSLWEAIRADEVARVLEAVRRETLPVAFAGPSGDASRLAAELETRVGQGPLLRPSAAPPPVTAQRLVVDDEQAAGGAVALAHALRFDRVLADRHRAALALLAESLARGEGSLEQRLKVAVGPGVTSSVELLPAADGGGVLLLGAEVPQAQVAAAWKVLMAALDSAARQSFRRDAVLRARQRLDAAARQRRADAGRVLLEELLPAPAWHWPPEDRWKKPAGAAALLAAAGDLLDSAARVAVESGTSEGPTVALAGFPQPRLVAPVEHCGRDLPLPCRPPKEQRRELARRRAVEVLQALGGRGADSTPPAYVARYTMSEQTAVGPVITEVEVEAGPDRARASWRTGEQILVVESSPGIDRMIVHG
ncbi:MAG TPA: hypothetical protein ENK10_08360, partial [Acidobacteria bacterium]|nr:hypothetical protein [Acidobacteriota bacterium]